jgi:hypothetical protein
MTPYRIDLQSRRKRERLELFEDRLAMFCLGVLALAFWMALGLA